MTATIAMRRAPVFDFLPPWAQSAAKWAAMAIATLVITRSQAKKKIDQGIEEARSDLEKSNKTLLNAQTAELHELRREVSQLRESVNALTALNQRYGAALAEKDLTIGELQRDLRIREARIMQLESGRHDPH